MRTILVVVAILAVGVPAVVVGSWLVTETMIEMTGGEEFCTTCHSMKPMAAAYRNDVHGGNNARGTEAECVGCHLPHDNSVHYLFAKGTTGMRDIWAELTHDPDTIDWHAMRERREEYVYDSGCLHCHVNLERGTMANNKAFVAHRPYFLGEIQKTCVGCHKHVGHKDLGSHLVTQR